MLIAHYWERGSLPSDDDRISRILGISKLKWRKLKPALVCFFNPDWTHNRIDEELEISAKKREKNRENGRAGGIKKHENNFKIEEGKSSKINETDLANAKANAIANEVALGLAYPYHTIEIDKSISKKLNKKDVLEILSECLPEETAAEVIAHRKALKSPLTPGAAKGLAKAFSEFGDPVAAANAMMARGWRGFKSEWMHEEMRAGPSKIKTGSELCLLALSRMDEDYEQHNSNTEQNIEFDGDYQIVA